MGVLDKETIKFGKDEFTIDPKLLEFNEASLNKYMEKEGVWYNFYSEKMADAEYLLQCYEMEYDNKYFDKFKQFKEEGNSDKLAEANAKIDSLVIESKKAVLAAKHKVKLIQGYLRAFDKSHDNAQSRGHMLRKEMDKITTFTKTDTVEKQIDELFEENNEK
jgi:hypothetical protein